MSELAEVRAVLFDLKQSMGRIEGSVAGMAETIKDRTTRVDAIERRITRVETSTSYSHGRTSVISTIAGALAGFASTWAARHF